MAASPNTLANLIGNLLYKIQGDPETGQVGKGVGLAHDLAVNAPLGLSQNVPHYMHEVK
jgi:hypothetical protein